MLPLDSKRLAASVDSPVPEELERQFSESDIKRIVNYYILKESEMKTSARNSFIGKVTAIRSGNILAEVEVATPSGLKVVSVITHDSLASLGISEGSLVTATVKAPGSSWSRRT